MWRSLLKEIRELWAATKGAGGSYRPDLHYMRGPGPKWRAVYATVSVKPNRPIHQDIPEHRI